MRQPDDWTRHDFHVAIDEMLDSTGLYEAVKRLQGPLSLHPFILAAAGYYETQAEEAAIKQTAPACS